MPEARRGWTDQQVEQVVGNLLRAGVLLAAAVVLLGGVLYLIEYGARPASPRPFPGLPADLCSPVGIVEDVLAGQSFGLIQLGLLLLVATPVARVVFSAYAFARQYDVTYVVVTLIVLAVLVYSLFYGEL
jgi:uncharacterized membrane protein